MRNLKLISILIAFVPGLAFGQATGMQSVNQTSLASAVKSGDDLVVTLSANFTAASPLGSSAAVATGIVLPTIGANGSFFYVLDPGNSRGEVMQVVSNLATSVYSVRRGIAGTKATGHASGAMVLIGPPNAFIAADPQGTCTASSFPSVNVAVNVVSGAEWLCSTVSSTWVPGFNNPAAEAPSTAVASAAGYITPSGPLFHVTGTAAITGFNLPLGFSHGSIVVIADGVFSWTAANNIAHASGTVISAQAYTFQYDSNTAKWYPSDAH